jgi:DNA-3-methyladenine glycosylase I
MKIRCRWAETNFEDYVKYHDEEWGVAVHDDRRLFEMLILEGAQAGLSWSTILKKRGNYRQAFKNFDPGIVADFKPEDIENLLKNDGIIRNRLKIESTIKNAKVFLKIQKEFGSFDSYLWKFVDNNQIHNKYERMEEIPTKTELSDKISNDLKKRGMNFEGSTIIYSFLQAVGIVNDHIIDCFRYKEIQG